MVTVSRWRTASAAVCPLLAAIFVGPDPAGAQAPDPPCPVAPVAELSGSGILAFGTALAADGDLLVVGAPGDSNDEAGLAEVYRRTEGAWTLEATLIGSDALGGARFGSAVDIDDGRIAIGAPVEALASGAVYLFVETPGGWVQEQRVTEEVPTLYARFGSSVLLDGDLLAVGAPRHNAAAPHGGAVLLFERGSSAWSARTMLTAADAGLGNRLGSAVAISGTRLIAGAPFGGDRGEGAAYIFDVESGAQIARLTADEAAPGSLLGAAVAMHGGRAIAGAPQHSTAATLAGAAWIFAEGAGGWAAEQMLALDAPATFDRFGAAVEMRELSAWVGAPERGIGGAVFEFRQEDDRWQARVQLSRSSDGGWMGGDLDLSGSHLFSSTGTGPFWNGVAIHLLEECQHDGEPSVCGVAALQTTLPDFGPRADSVALSEELVVGGAQSDTNALGGAMVQLRERGGWGASQLLVGSDTVVGDEFGISVATAGEWVLIGAPMRVPPGQTCFGGGAYVFRQVDDVFVQVALLEPSSPSACARFGRAVAMNGDLAAVSARGGQHSRGAVYLYRIRGSVWEYEALLTRLFGQSSDRFGDSVAIHGDDVVVGAPGDESISVFHLEPQGWVEVEQLRPPDEREVSNFGADVAISLPRIAAGSWDHSVHVFITDGSRWLPDGALVGLNGFGRSVAIDGDRLLVNQTSSDHALVFARSPEGWHELGRMPAHPVDTTYALDVAMHGSTVAVSGGYVATAFVYETTSSLDCNGNDVVDGCEIAAGLVQDLDGDGVPDECEAPPGDLSGDGIVGADDLIALIVAWGPCPAAPAPCTADIDGNGAVNVDDLLIVLLAWST